MLLADDPTGLSAATLAETRAAILAEAGEWKQVSGGVPDGGFIDEVFRKNAALDLDATGDTESIQRVNNYDANTNADWTQSEGSFGGGNSGQ